jgi:hypothetical protein
MPRHVELTRSEMRQMFEQAWRNTAALQANGDCRDEEPRMYAEENLKVALELARAGIYVFPAQVSRRFKGWTKKPAIAGWRELATTDEIQLRVWWRLYPRALPGIELGRSKIYVVDPDRHGGADGIAAWERLIRQLGDLPPHPVTITPQGQHHIFKQPTEPLSNSPGGLPDGIDARGDGGWIAAPGAIRDDGAVYTPLDGTPSLIETYAAGTIPEVPGPLVELIKNGRTPRERPAATEPNGSADLDAEFADMAPGRVNATQCKLIGTLFSYGVPYDEIEDRVVAGTMAMAAAKGLTDWTREAEVGFVRKAMGALLHSRCRQEENPIIAPNWVAPELVESWEQIAAQGGRPLVFWHRDQWRVRNMAWAWNGGGEAHQTSFTDTPSNAGAATESVSSTEEPVEAALKVLAGAGAWLHGNELPPPQECSFDQLLPLVGVGTLDGQYGCHKTHLLVDAAVAFTCTPESYFAGKKRLRRGGAVIIETEYSDIPLRVACAAKHRDIDEKLPLVSLPEVPPMLAKKQVNPRTMHWYRTILKAAQVYFKWWFDLPLAFVGIDPLIDAFGAESENSAEEANEAKKAFRTLAHEFGCVFWIDDHMGKDVERGGRGSSAKPAKADFILALPEKVEDFSQPRTLTVKKLRNMPDGWGVDFSLKTIEVDAAGGKTATNLAVVWGDVVGKGEGASHKVGRPPRKQRMALRVLEQMIRNATRPDSTAATWIELEAWNDELLNQTIIEPDDVHKPRTFQRIKDGLLERGEIKICGDQVCIPLS